MNQVERQAMIDYLNEQRRHLLAQAAATERMIEVLKSSQEIMYNRDNEKRASEPMKIR